MPTEAEIEAAAKAIKLTSSPASSCRSWAACARAALKAAELVRETEGRGNGRILELENVRDALTEELAKAVVDASLQQVRAELAEGRTP